MLVAVIFIGKGIGKMKVVFHVDEINKWPMVLANVKNFKREIPEAAITVVANGEAVKYYVSADWDRELLQTVDFVACQNALNSNTITAEAVPITIRIVNAGVVELVQKQNDGYAYIRP